VDEYVVETLMADLVGHDKMPSAFVVYLHLYWRSSASRARSVRASHQSIATETGLSKSAVQAAVRHLVRRKLLRSERESITAVPEYFVLRPWRR
jgi:hypothetical protein